MVSPLGAGCHGNGHADDTEEHEDQRPPRVVGEPDVVAQRGGYYGADEGDDPGKLHEVSTQPPLSVRAVLTIAIEMVASAKGSPMMRPTLKVDRWP